jgi:hypothetical protein
MAARNALQMPKLRTLVLWNGEEWNACAFMYQVEADYVYMTWRGKLGPELQPRGRRGLAARCS